MRAHFFLTHPPYPNILSQSTESYYCIRILPHPFFLGDHTTCGHVAWSVEQRRGYSSLSYGPFPAVLSSIHLLRTPSNCAEALYK